MTCFFPAADKPDYKGALVVCWWGLTLGMTVQEKSIYWKEAIVQLCRSKSTFGFWENSQWYLFVFANCRLFLLFVGCSSSLLTNLNGSLLSLLRSGSKAGSLPVSRSVLLQHQLRCIVLRRHAAGNTLLVLLAALVLEVAPALNRVLGFKVCSR